MFTKLLGSNRAPVVGTPYLRLDPRGAAQRFYEHTSLALGDEAGRAAYFEQLEAANPQARFERLGTRDAVRARELRVEVEVLSRMEGAGKAGFYGSGNSPFEQRIIVMNELPAANGEAYDAEAAVLTELAGLGRICRAMGFTIFYGVRDLGEFKAKGWGLEGTFNASCNTQVHVGADGSVTSMERADDGGLEDVYLRLGAA